MLLPRPDHVHMTQIDAETMYYVAGFFSQKCKKLSYAACGDIVGEDSALEMNIEEKIPENRQLLVDEINRGGLVRPSVLVMQYVHLPGILIYR